MDMLTCSEFYPNRDKEKNPIDLVFKKLIQEKFGEI